jgi:hypothetical protein
MGDRHHGAIADGDRCRIEDGLRGSKISRTGRHVGGGSNVEEPLGSLWTGGRDVRRCESGEKSLSNVEEPLGSLWTGGRDVRRGESG